MPSSNIAALPVAMVMLLMQQKRERERDAEHSLCRLENKHESIDGDLGRMLITNKLKRQGHFSTQLDQ